MKKALPRVIVYCVIAVFLCWYIPSAYMNVLSCDDFWFGTNVHKFGFWNNQIYYWKNWEGSYTHTFFFFFLHLFTFSRVPFIFNISSLIILVLSICFFMRTFLSKDKNATIVSSLYLTSVILSFVIGGAEIRYWICASFTYILELSSVIVFVSLYHRILTIDKQNKSWIGILYALLIIIIAGSKLTFITFCVYGIIVHDLLYKGALTRACIVTCLVLFIVSLFNILAPGNLIRLSEETAVLEEEPQMSFLYCIWYRVKTILPVFILAITVIPITSFLQIKREGVSLDKATLWKIFLISILFFTVDGVIMYICFRDPGPARIYITAELSIYIFFTIIACILATQNKWASWNQHINVIVSSLMLIVGLYYLSLLPNCYDFSTKSRERDKMVYESKTDTLRIPRLPESHMLLSYFSNDIEWIKNVYLPYFDKAELVVNLDD